MIFLQIVGGVALTVFGIRFLRKGLDRLFGRKLGCWLAMMTRNRWKAFLGGICAGTVAPSSTALALVTVQMLNMGSLSVEGMLAVLLGAYVGIGITVQLIAFHIHDYYFLFLIGGVIGFQFLRRETFRGIGQCLIAMGFIFLAMKVIGEGAAQLAAQPETTEVIHLVRNHPWLVLAVVSGLALLLQSSTATIGLGMGLAAGGVLPIILLIPWIIGANLGISITAVLAGWNSPDGRRLGVAHLLIKTFCGFIVILGLSWSVSLFEALPGSLFRKIAIFHSLFNLTAGLISLPFLGSIMRLAEFLSTPRAASWAGEKPASYLAEEALETPSVALAHATRETMQMTDHVKNMLEQFWKAQETGSADLAKQVQQQDDKIDEMYRNIKRYLSRIHEHMSEQEVRWQFTLLTFSNELESIGDILDKNLCDVLLKQEHELVMLSECDNAILKTLYRKVTDRVEIAISLLTNRDQDLARHFLEGKEQLNEWCREAQKEHYDRLRLGDDQVISSSSYFLDMLNSFRRINSHISTIGYAI